MIAATSHRPTARPPEPVAARRFTPSLPQVLVAGEGPAGVEPLCELVGDEAEVEQVPDFGKALARCLEAPVDVLFVNLFCLRPSELTALALFRQTRPEQYVAACADASLLPALEQAGLADALFILEPVRESSVVIHNPERA